MAGSINELLDLAIERRASDLHIVVGVSPNLRVDGRLFPIPDEPVLTEEVVEGYLKEILAPDVFKTLKEERELDFSLSYSQKARFRVNAYTQKGTKAIAFRTIPTQIPTIKSLNLPQILYKFTQLKQGLILFTGPTGHGKSSAIASVIDEINKQRAEHILTIEDPIEFVFPPIKSIITQRELGQDTKSWAMSLRSALREDPDVVLVGEMRDLETIQATLTVAETGHLVFATLHTNSAAQTIDRIVDVFPDEQQDQVKLQLSNVLEAVVSLRLVPAVTEGRYPAYEIMLGTSAIANAIREGKTHQIDSIIQTSSELGMNILETSLAKLATEGKITYDTAQSFAIRPDELARLIKRNA